MASIWLIMFEVTSATVSIPKRVSEVLWPHHAQTVIHRAIARFQSLKGFQRFCGCNRRDAIRSISRLVSIPKRVSEVLWLLFLSQNRVNSSVSIPKRVSEVLWLSFFTPGLNILAFQSLKGFQRFCGWRNIDRAIATTGCFNP